MKGSQYQIKEMCGRMTVRQTSSFVLFCGRVSTGFIHATPGEMKSFRSSADRIALMVAGYRCGRNETTQLDNRPESIARQFVKGPFARRYDLKVKERKGDNAKLQNSARVQRKPSNQQGWPFCHPISIWWRHRRTDKH